jgi:hypothetical protein
MNLPVFKVDQEFFCLDVASIKRAVKSGTAWMQVESTDGIVMRKMARCNLRRHGDKVYLADVVTGTLYREDTGLCMTSSSRRVTGPGEEPTEPGKYAERYGYGYQQIGASKPKLPPAEPAKPKLGRGKLCGEGKGSAKLTEEIVRKLREVNPATGMHVVRTATAMKEWGVSRGAISDVRRRRTWGHVA